MIGFVTRLFGFGRKAELVGNVGRKMSAPIERVRGVGGRPRFQYEVINDLSIPKAFDAGGGKFYGSQEGMLMDFKYPSN